MNLDSNQTLILLAVAVAVVVNVPWTKLSAWLPAFKLPSFGNGQSTVDGWDSDAPPPTDVQAWAEAIDKACPGASNDAKWSYLIEKLSPIEAAIRSQGGGK